jgi:pimeloyl-ACP methyl ester carboxylesterase
MKTARERRFGAGMIWPLNKPKAMAVEEVVSSVLLNESPDQVWATVRDFCEPWHPAIDRMWLEQDRRGSQIRAFTVAGEATVYREQLSYFSDSDRSYTYFHLEGIAGIDAYSATLRVSEGVEGGSVATMTASITASKARAVEAAFGTKMIFDMGLTALTELPKKTTLADANSIVSSDGGTEQLMLIDEPKLALQMTPKKSGTLCLFLHGIGGRGSNWSQQMGVAGSVMQAASLDLRGYGDSSLGSNQSTIEDYCSDILRVREALGADRLVLCGLSFGAWIATSFAMRYPDLLSGLVLSGGCTGMSEASAEEREAFRASREVPINKGLTPTDFAPDVVKVLAGPTCDPKSQDLLFTSMAAIPSDTYRDALTCFTNPPEQFDFSKLTMPILMMTGEFDRLAPPHEIRGVANQIVRHANQADVRFEILDTAGHVCNVENPELYNRHLHSFLDRISQ